MCFLGFSTVYCPSLSTFTSEAVESRKWQSWRGGSDVGRGNWFKALYIHAGIVVLLCLDRCDLK